MWLMMLSSPFSRTAKVRIDVLIRTIGLGEPLRLVALIVENEVDVEMQNVEYAVRCNVQLYVNQDL